MTLKLSDIIWLTAMFCITVWSLATIHEPTGYDMDFLIKVQNTAYNKGLKDANDGRKIVTVYLCRDWIPTLGYKAWRQCNMDYIAQQEEEDYYQ